MNHYWNDFPIKNKTFFIAKLVFNFNNVQISEITYKLYNYFILSKFITITSLKNKTSFSCHLLFYSFLKFCSLYNRVPTIWHILRTAITSKIKFHKGCANASKWFCRFLLNSFTIVPHLLYKSNCFETLWYLPK